MARIVHTKTLGVSAIIIICVVVFTNDMYSMINHDFTKILLNDNDMKSKDISKTIYSLSNSQEFLSNSRNVLSNLQFWKKKVCKKVDQYNSRENPSQNFADSKYERYLENSKIYMQYEKDRANPNKYTHDDKRKQKRLTQAIIIGVMKCGTLTLKKMMKMHSKIVMSENELPFFDWNYHLGLDWYQSKMPLSYSNQIVLEKSPSYFRNVEVPTRMHNMNSAMRIILIVKNPTMRSISEYIHHKAHDRCPLSFQDLVIRPNGEVESNHPIIMQSMYVHFLKNYLAVFPREQILVLGSEQFVTDPLPVIKKVEQFLNLEPEITEDNIYFDKEKGYFCMNYNGTIECLPDDKGREHPEVDEDVLTKLRTFFAPYNQRLYDLVGQDFGWPT